MKMKKLNYYFSIHYSFLILMFASFFASLLGLFVLYFICLLAHEIMHAIVAKKRGYKIGKIKLLATGAVLEAENDEFSYSDEIFIAFAGPLLNLIIALILIALWWIFPESYNYTQDLCVINLALFGFNILPIFPLDGGRILLAIVSKKTDRKIAVTLVKTISIVFCILLFLLFLISLIIDPNFSLGIMAITLFVGVITEDKSAVYKRTFYLSRKRERIKKNGVELRVLYVDENMPLYKLLKMLNARHYTIFVCVDENLKQKQIISEKQLLDKLGNS